HSLQRAMLRTPWSKKRTIADHREQIGSAVICAIDRESFDLDALLWSISAAMNFDISHLLDAWDYQAGQIVVRKFKGKDGKEKIQLRVDLGILQMNAAGRPDGKQPFGHESLLEHFESRLEKHRAEHDSEDGFRLSPEDCAKLQQEAI